MYTLEINCDLSASIIFTNNREAIKISSMLLQDIPTQYFHYSFSRET